MDNQENGGWENANGIGESDDEQEQQADETMADPEAEEVLGLWDDDVNEEEDWNLFNMINDQNNLQFNNDHVEEVIPQIQENGNHLALQHNENHLALQPQQIQHVQDAGLLDNLDWLNIFNLDAIGEQAPVVGGIEQEHIEEDIPQIQENGNHFALQHNGNQVAFQPQGPQPIQQVQADGLLENLANLEWLDIFNLVGIGEQAPVVGGIEQEPVAEDIPQIQVNGNMLNGNVVVQNGGLENGGWENANGIGESDDEQEQQADEIIADPEAEEDLGLWDDDVNEEENWNLFNMIDDQNVANNDPAPDEFFEGIEDYIEGLVSEGED